MIKIRQLLCLCGFLCSVFLSYILIWLSKREGLWQNNWLGKRNSNHTLSSFNFWTKYHLGLFESKYWKKMTVNLTSVPSHKTCIQGIWMQCVSIIRHNQPDPFQDTSVLITHSYRCQLCPVWLLWQQSGGGNRGGSEASLPGSRRACVYFNQHTSAMTKGAHHTFIL